MALQKGGSADTLDPLGLHRDDELALFAFLGFYAIFWDKLQMT
jgi:hypothetical protein